MTQMHDCYAMIQDAHPNFRTHITFINTTFNMPHIARSCHFFHVFFVMPHLSLICSAKRGVQLLWLTLGTVQILDCEPRLHFTWCWALYNQAAEVNLLCLLCSENKGNPKQRITHRRNPTSPYNRLLRPVRLWSNVVNNRPCDVVIPTEHCPFSFTWDLIMHDKHNFHLSQCNLQCINLFQVFIFVHRAPKVLLELIWNCQCYDEIQSVHFTSPTQSSGLLILLSLESSSPPRGAVLQCRGSARRTGIPAWLLESDLSIGQKS